MKNALILIIEDDLDILHSNRDALELVGYRVITGNTLAIGRELVKKQSPDLIILDVLLPDGNGLEYCEELRGESGVRILFLSALNTKADALNGLRVGGDDYMAKPYDLDELILRVETLLRRGKLLGSIDTTLKISHLELDLSSRRALLHGQDILLKPKEFSLLEILIRSQGKSISSEELYKRVWGMNTIGDIRTVKEHISRIRKKLEPDNELHILTERGNGYRITV